MDPGKTPQSGPYQAELLAKAGALIDPWPYQPQPRPSPHTRHIWGGRGQPRSSRRKAEVAAAHLSWACRVERDSVLILRSVSFSTDTPSHLPGKKQAKQSHDHALPWKKKILGNKIQRHLFILFFSVIILKMKNS